MSENLDTCGKRRVGKERDAAVPISIVLKNIAKSVIDQLPAAQCPLFHRIM